MPFRPAPNLQFGQAPLAKFPFGPRMAWNDWADPAEQFLQLKRASLLARLAQNSARGFGRK